MLQWVQRREWRSSGAAEHYIEEKEEKASPLK
jgi:hypothetical protein